MSDINITIEGGKSKRLLTKDKYCNDNILITALSDAPIKVKELPSDNIVEGRLYELEQTILKDIILVEEDGFKTSFAKYFEIGALQGGLFVIPTFTTENVVITATTEEIYGLYYIEDQQDIFVYVDIGDGNLMWVTATDAIGIPNNGQISHISEAVMPGAYYILEEKNSYHWFNQANKGLSGVYLNGVPFEYYYDNITYTIINVPTIPTADILISDVDNEIFYFYYIDEYQDTFIYIGQWVPVSVLLGTEPVYVTSLEEALHEDYIIYGVLSDGWTDYIVPDGGLFVTENGSYSVIDKEYVLVDVGIPDGYIYPEGTRTIRSNGEYDIRYYEKVAVDVPAPPLPTPVVNCMVQSTTDFPVESANGSIVFVLGGEIR